MGIFDPPDKPDYFYLPERPVNKWWCPICKIWISNEEVTNEETHDPLWGGCGERVTMKEYPHCSVCIWSWESPECPICCRLGFNQDECEGPK